MTPFHFPAIHIQLCMTTKVPRTRTCMWSFCDTGLKTDGRYGTGYSVCFYMWLPQIAVLQKYRSEILFGSLQKVDRANVTVSCIMLIRTIHSARWTTNMRTTIFVMVTELVSKIQFISLFFLFHKCFLSLSRFQSKQTKCSKARNCSLYNGVTKGNMKTL